MTKRAPKGLVEQLAERVAADVAAGKVLRADDGAQAVLHAMIGEALAGEPVQAALGDAKAEFVLARAAAVVLRQARRFAAEAAMLARAAAIKPSARLGVLRSMALVNAQSYRSGREAADAALVHEPWLAQDFAAHLAELDAFESLTAELHAMADSRIPSRSKPTQRIAYCLHNSLPHAQGGYAMRSHALAKAMAGEGRDLRIYSRPGFPVDTEGWRAAVADAEEIDGLSYRFETSFGRRGRAFAYLAQAADYFERVFRADAIGIVHAATPFWTALPAAIAARRLGLQFVYEVRSFWAITREARDPGFSQTPQARRDETLERIALALADGVVTLNEAMRDHLGEYGVEPGRIAIAPNCVDTDRFAPQPSDPALAARYGLDDNAIVIGYLGAMLGYEGLDLLIEAAAPLAQADPRVHLLIIGADPAKRDAPGTIEHDLGRRIAATGSARISLIDRIAPEQAPAHYALFDICAYPRRGDRVCELVSPLKPLEAMASGKPVIVSDVGGMRDLVAHDRNGISVPREDVSALRAALGELIENESKRRNLGQEARAFMIAERRWQAAARTVVTGYDRLAAGASDRADHSDALAQGLAALE